MKGTFLIIFSTCILQFFSEAQLRTPAPSPLQNIRQDFALSSIELSYSRPGMKGRKIFGDLVPYGKVWRTGANQATILSFGEEVSIGGTKIAAGKYGLLTIPEKNNWIIIITKQTDVTSPAAYKQESDVVRVSVKPTTIPGKIESFTMQFANVKPTSCELQIMWENTMVALPIRADVDSKVMSDIEKSMSGDNPPYYAAASYYFENGKDLAKAKEWAQKAADGNPTAFYMYYLLAKIQAKTGDKKAAIATAKKSIELSKEAKNDDYVVLNQKLLKTLQ